MKIAGLMEKLRRLPGDGVITSVKSRTRAADGVRLLDLRYTDATGRDHWHTFVMDEEKST